MSKKLLSILALLCLTVTSAWAEIVASGTCGVDDPATEEHDESQDVRWSLTDNGVLTISGTGAMVNEYTGWYGYREYITSIVIGNGVTSIGIDAFYGENRYLNLTSVTFADNSVLETIGVHAFCDSGLTSLTIPASVKTIGDNAFEGCKNLTSVTFATNSALETIGDIAFAQCTALTTVAIPASVTSIGESAFDYCGNLTSVTLNSNPAIGTSAFNESPNAVVTMNLTAKSAGDAKWMTFYNQNYSFLADENTEVFKVTLSGDVLTMHKVDNRIVDAGTGVVLKSTGNPVMTLTTTPSENSVTSNLTGVSNPAGEVSDGTFYVLNYKEGTGVGFYKLESDKKVGVGKAYLTYGDGGGEGAREFFSFDNEATALTLVKSEKRIVNSEVYDLQGRRVVNPSKGLYIVNGKIVVIK